LWLSSSKCDVSKNISCYAEFPLGVKSPRLRQGKKQILPPGAPRKCEGKIYLLYFALHSGALNAYGAGFLISELLLCRPLGVKSLPRKIRISPPEAPRKCKCVRIIYLLYFLLHCSPKGRNFDFNK
jgi:hypothetical protein